MTGGRGMRSDMVGRARWGGVVGAAFALSACGAARPPAPAVVPPVAAAAPAPDTAALRAAAVAAAAAPRDTARLAPAPLALDSAPPLDPTDGSGRVRWIGREADHTLAPADRALLRTVFGIDDVRRIYIPTTAGEVLRYAAHAPGCPTLENGGRPTTRGGACRVVGVRIGLAAPRDTGETWDAFTARVEHGGPRAWTASGGRTEYAGLDALDPDARPAFERLVADARAAGFPIHIRETFRTPERQAAILSRNDGRTTTLTSAHSYGRAVDISVAGRHSAWVEFRRWVLRQQNGAFRLIGTPESTWDWPHVEYVGAATATPLGYRTVDALVAAARACRAGAASDAAAAARCTVAPPRPAADVAVTTVSDDAPASRSRGRRGRHHASRGSSRGSSRGGRSHGKSAHGKSHGKSSRAASHASSHGTAHAKSSHPKASHAKRHAR